VDECASFVVDTLVVGREQTEQIAFGLVGDHLQQVGQVLTLGGQFDDLAVDHILNGDTARHGLAFCFEVRAPPHRRQDLASLR